MVKNILQIVIFTLAALQVKAANVVLTLKDKSSQETLIGAHLHFVSEGKEKHGLSNKKGQFVLQNVELPLDLKIEYVGYENIKTTISQQNLTLQSDQNFVGTLFLQKDLTTFKEIVVTAQSKPVLATQSIYKVNTISSQQIAERGAVTLNDVLNYELNNFVSNDNLLGSSVNIAGIGGQNVKILINGIPVLGRENGNIDLGQLNLNNIKRIETIQGPMSVMYGSNALGGVINLITNTSQKALGFNARMYLESIGKYNLSAGFNASKKKHNLQASFARNFFQGWTPSQDSVDRYQLWKPKTQYTADLQYHFQHKKLGLTYYSSLMSEIITNKGLPIINPYEAYAFDEYYRTQRLINSLSAKINLNEKSSFSFLNSVSNYNRTKNRYKKNLVNLTQFETKNAGDQDTTRFTNLNLRGTYQSSSLKNLEFQTGYEYSLDKGESFKLSEQVKDISDLGIFASILYHKHKFDIQPSARFTLNNQYGSAFTPAFHAKYNVDSSMQIRASYAKGFRAPSLKEMYLQFVDQNHTIIGNENLKPEIGHHAELGLEKRMLINKNLISFTATGSMNRIQNMITLAIYEGSGVLRKYANLQQYNNWLLNAKVNFRNKNYSVDAGAGLISVESTGFIPQHTIYEFSSNISYLLRPLKTNLNFNYKLNSKQPILTVDEKYLFTQPIHVANFSFQKYLFSNALSLQMGVKNLFNLQTSTLSSTTDLQGGGHLSAAGIQLFPARSIFMDIQYRFTR